MIKNIILGFALLCMVGCSGMQLTGSTNDQAMGYISGKGMALSIYKIAPTSAPVIEQAWMDMMGRCSAMTEIPPTEMQGFFNEVLLKQVPTLKNDKYGFSGDLAFFATLYGAQVDPTGGMTMLKPVPMVVAKAFQIGYEGGRSVAMALK